MDNNKKAIKSGVWYTVSNFLIRSIGFITTPVFTRLLTQEEFGVYNNYTSWLSILTIFVTLNLDSTLVSARFDYENKFDNYIISILSLSSFITLTWIGMLNIFSAQVEIITGLNIVYINAMLLYLLFLPALNLFLARERYLFEYKYTVIVSLVVALGTALLSVLLVINMDNKLKARIVGAITPTILLGIAFYVFFIKKGKKLDFSVLKYAIPIALPYIPHLLSMTLLNSTDRIMIDRWCGSRETALYSLAYNCGMLVTLLMTSLNSAFAPWLGEKLHSNKIEEIKRFSKIYISLFFVLAIGIMLVSPEVLLILGGKSYMDAIYVLAPVSMGCICQFLYTLFVNVEQFKKKTVKMAYASATAAIINLLLNYLFIPKFGYLAAAYTTLVGYLILLILHMLIVKKLDVGDIYDNKYILVIVALGIVLTVFITMIYANSYIRYTVILFYAISLLMFVYKNRFILVRFIKKKK